MRYHVFTCNRPLVLVRTPVHPRSLITVNFATLAYNSSQVAGPRVLKRVFAPITPHPQRDQQHARQATEYRPRDTQLAEFHRRTGNLSSWRANSHGSLSAGNSLLDALQA